MKYSATSTKLRNRGNELYKNGQHREALAEYTDAIRYAPYPSDELASALGNRSAALFELKLYAECIRDLDRALALGQNEGQKDKWRSRRERASGFAQEAPVGGRYDQLFEFFTKTESSTVSLDKGLPSNSQGPSETVVGLSSAVTVSHSTAAGRHLTALGDIPAGSLVIYESPYVISTYDNVDAVRRHCAFCCVALPADAVPCSGCNSELQLYCGDECRDGDWGRSHWLECGLKTHCVRHARKAIRILAATHLDVITQAAELARDNKFAGTKQEQFCCDAKSCLSLVGHEIEDNQLLSPEERDRLPESSHELSSWDIVTKMVVDALYEKDFFSALNWPTSWTLSQKEEQVRLITRMVIERWRCNAMIVDTFQSEGSPLVLDGGLYPVSALMNHSCVPNVCRSLTPRPGVGAVLSVRTTVDLQKGDELFNSYGPIYMSMSRASRQRNLQQQYRFTCECAACADPWFKAAEMRAASLMCANSQSGCTGGLLPLAPKGEKWKCFQCGMMCMRETIAPTLLALKRCLGALHSLSEPPPSGAKESHFFERQQKLDTLVSAVSECSLGVHRDHAQLAAIRCALGKMLAQSDDKDRRDKAFELCKTGVEALKRLRRLRATLVAL